MFFDIETPSKRQIKIGGRKYAIHPSTKIVSAVFLIGRDFVIWTPGREIPDNLDQLGLTNLQTELTFHFHSGDELPALARDALRARRSLCAHNASGFDSHVWRAKGLPEPDQWIDTLPLARAAGLPGKLDTIGLRLFGVGKDPGGKALLDEVSQVDKCGQLPEITSDQLIRIARYNARDVILLADVYHEVAEHSEPAVLAADAAINHRGVARISTSKLETACAAIAPDGRLRDLFVYHGAHTGRFAGRNVQPQNLPRPHRKLKAVEKLLPLLGDFEAFKNALPDECSVADGVAALIRACFRAKPGHVLVRADLAAIEARGVAWCAGERRLLKQFEAGADTYCDLASRVLGALSATRMSTSATSVRRQCSVAVTAWARRSLLRSVKRKESIWPPQTRLQKKSSRPIGTTYPRSQGPKQAQGGGATEGSGRTWSAPHVGRLTATDLSRLGSASSVSHKVI
jgi:hypothetical protein